MKEERILIVEDDISIAENIQEILELLGYVNTDIANSANQCIKIIKKYRPDLIFMDIKLKGDKDGIELGEIVKQMVDAPLVYVTSYSDPTIIERAKRINPAGFIVKPFNTNDIHAIVEIVLYNKRTKPTTETATVSAASDSPFLVTDAVFIKADNAFERVSYEDIYYVEANGNMVTIFTKNRDYNIRKSMKEIEEILPSQLFLRVQKSFIVQLGQIESFNTKEITLRSGSMVQVGRQYYNSFLAKLSTITES
ncbi:LytR/AlgR family response regulator transcription factor [Algoriphagus winogradskyi]|jgi:DNA-binding LytR/AlgR family response regulator|uniref:Two component transcriptional regulator, LytTR family n=1 Tax=Algoriphagus winogradskyi TaxID=237017 RepID=A0ABY1NP60_9BACT|nr:LytTR family transcriptional regulator DNA-binding domain-containing protein [Algoriphagus winogradskyi]SMP13692.1 two component transcriptional regulator, LytTR family [Algoriphagus winogradskyi]